MASSVCGICGTFDVGSDLQCKIARCNLVGKYGSPKHRWNVKSCFFYQSPDGLSGSSGTNLPVDAVAE